MEFQVLGCMGRGMRHIDFGFVVCLALIIPNKTAAGRPLLEST